MSAAVADNFEDLNNADLRAKCREYDLPNIPVTDTSRKILIRKLRAAIDLKNGVPVEKGRRDTIHVSKIPTDVSADESNTKSVGKSTRRTTIAVTNTQKFADPVPETVKMPAPTSARRSSRHTPTPVEDLAIKAKPVALESLKRKPAIMEEGDTSEDDLILIEAAQRTERSPPRQKAVASRDRRSRSSSLTKSPTVTTSYNRDANITALQETESESDVEVARHNKVEYKSKEYTSIRPNSVGKQSEISGKKNFTQAGESSTYSSAYTQKEPTEFSSKGRYSLYGDTGASSTSYTQKQKEVSSRRRYTTGIKPSLHDYGAENSDEALEAEIEKEASTPYYSDFARRLEKIKNEQFNLPAGQPRDISINRDTISGYGRGGRYQREVQKHNSSFGESVRDFFINLDQKHKIKQKICIVLAIFVLLTIYIFLFH